MSRNHQGNQRYLRHGEAFPDRRREQTLLVELGGYDAPWTSTFLITGVAAAGIPLILSDHPGRGRAGHWFRCSHDLLTRKLNDEVVFDHLDPDPGIRVGRVKRVASQYANAWVVVHINDRGVAEEALAPLAEARLDVRVLLALTARGGLLVERMPSPAAARQRLREMPKYDPVPPGDQAELSLAVAGVCVNEIMLGGTVPSDDLNTPRTIGFYSQHRPQRVQLEPHGPRQALIEEIAEPVAETTSAGSFSGKRIKTIGAGALANWAMTAISLDGNVSTDVLDGDTTEIHNLARQPLLVDHVGRPKAPAIAQELGRLDPLGSYRGVVRHVQKPEDLEPLFVDALTALPDNDPTRAIGGKAAWDWAVPFAEAGTSSRGGQFAIQVPHRACLACLTSITLGERLGATGQGTGVRVQGSGLLAGPSPLAPRLSSRAPGRSANSCLRAGDSVVSSNMVVAALMVAELRQCLAGRRSENLRFHGVGGGSNRLTWQIGDPPCEHREEAGRRVIAES